MSKQYNQNLVEAVGSSFYYYVHMKDINLAGGDHVDFEKLTKGWADEYFGNFNFNSMPPIHFNTFKPCVDQLVYRIMDATEKEIERRVNEILNDRLSKLETQAKIGDNG